MWEVWGLVPLPDADEAPCVGGDEAADMAVGVDGVWSSLTLVWKGSCARHGPRVWLGRAPGGSMCECEGEGEAKAAEGVRGRSMVRLLLMVMPLLVAAAATSDADAAAEAAAADASAWVVVVVVAGRRAAEEGARWRRELAHTLRMASLAAEQMDWMTTTGTSQQQLRCCSEQLPFATAVFPPAPVADPMGMGARACAEQPRSAIATLRSEVGDSPRRSQTAVHAHAACVARKRQ